MTNQEILEFCGKLFFINILISSILMFLTTSAETLLTYRTKRNKQICQSIESLYLRSVLTIPFTFTLMGIAEYIIPLVK